MEGVTVMNKRCSVYLFGLLFLSLLGCSKSVDDMRRDIAVDSSADISLGVVWTGVGEANCSSLQDADMFVHGVCLAVKEINEKGGLLGRNLNILFRDDNGDVSEARIVAQSLVDNPEVMAVMGHAASYLTVAAAPTYEFFNVPLIAPAATSLQLGQMGYEKVFRTLPSDEATGWILADYVTKLGCVRHDLNDGSQQVSAGCKSVLIYYMGNKYGRSLATAFQEQASAHGVRVLDRVSYDEDSRLSVLREQIRIWKRYFESEADVIFVAGTMPVAGEIISIIREEGWLEGKLKIVGGNDLYTPELLALEASEGTVVASPISLSSDHALVGSFEKEFKNTYALEPDVWAAQGYDAVNLIRHAIEQAKTPLPSSVIQVFKRMNGSQGEVPCMDGVTGPNCFDEKGSVDMTESPKLYRVNHQAFLPLSLN